MLIDEDAISQAEHTFMFFEAATDVTFIGAPTAGANGDVTNLVLPGNIRVNFSGQAEAPTRLKVANTQIAASCRGSEHRFSFPQTP
jgi:hypothetical protein